MDESNLSPEDKIRLEQAQKFPKPPYKLGWIPQQPDPRDKYFSAAKNVNLATLPTSVDLSAKCGPVVNQGPLGSCTANAIASALEYDQIAQGVKDHFTPSRLFIYYNEREMEGTVTEDAGAVIRDGIKSVASQGAPKESSWPYDVAKFKSRPSDAVYAEALDYQAIEYSAVLQTQSEIEGCLASGFPIVFGFTVYSSFDRIGANGLMPMPGMLEAVEGGHAVKCVGYNRLTGYFKIKNSWGTGWGDKGYFYMPYMFLLNPSRASDFWTIRKVEVVPPAPVPPIPGPTPDGWTTLWGNANIRVQTHV